MDRPITTSRWRGRSVWAAAALVTILVLGGLWLARPQAGSLSVDRAGLNIAPVTQAVFQDFLSTRARVEPARNQYVDAVSVGRVETVEAEDGDLVQAGQLIATLSNPQLVLEVTQRETDIAARLSDLSSQRLAIERGRLEREREIREARFGQLQAERELDVRARLHARGFESDAGLERARVAARFEQEQVEALTRAEADQVSERRLEREAIDRTEALLVRTLAATRSGLEALNVRAPMAGRLTALELEPGQAIAIGDRLAQIGSAEDFHLIADVDEFYLGRIAVGQTATMTVDGQSFSLKVARVLPAVTDGRFRAEFDFVGDPPPALRRGQTFDLRVTLGAAGPALTLPNGPFLTDGGGQWVFVVSADNATAVRRPVSIGRRNAGQVEILSGLQPGDRVIVSSYAAFGDRSRLLLR